MLTQKIEKKNGVGLRLARSRDSKIRSVLKTEHVSSHFLFTHRQVSNMQVLQDLHVVSMNIKFPP